MIKKWNRIYWFFFALGVTAFIYQVHFLVLFLIVFHLMLFAFYQSALLMIFERIAKRSYCRILDLYVKQCDPEKFIETVKKKFYWKGNAGVRIALRIQLCYAYMDASQMEGAAKIIESIPELPPNHSRNNAGLTLRKMYDSCRFLYYLQIGDLKQAETILNQLRDFFLKEKLYSDNTAEFDEVYVPLFNKLKIAKGEYGGMEAYYEKRYSEKADRLAKVKIQYLLGIIYRHNHETKKAIKAFQFVEQNGNRLYITRLAKNALNYEQDGSF